MSRRLILLGNFLFGEHNRAKRSVWIQSTLRSGKFDAIHVLERGYTRDTKEQNSDLKDVSYTYVPTYLHQSLFSRRQAFLGCFNILSLFLFSQKLALEVLALEWSLIKHKARLTERAIAIIRMFSGYYSFLLAIKQLHLCPTDVAVIWAEHGSTSRLFKYFANKLRIRVLWSEYGEIPETFFVNETGMFDESSFVQNRDALQKIIITKKDKQKAKDLLQRITSSRISQKDYSETLMLNSADYSSYSKIIYVNGVEPFGSGLQPRVSSFSQQYSPWFSSNEEILNAVANLAVRRNWLVLFKNHPNLSMYLPQAKIVDNRWGKHVMILDNEEIHSVLGCSDAMVTLGSKSVFLALSQDVPVLILGPYTINQEDLSYGLSNGPNVEVSLDWLMEAQRGSRVDREGFECFVARMMKCYLYTFDEYGGLWRRGPTKMHEDLDAWCENKARTLVDYSWN